MDDKKNELNGAVDGARTYAGEITRAKTIEEVILAVAEIMGTTVDAIKARGASRRLTLSRELFVYYLRRRYIDERGNIFRYTDLAGYLNRDHSTLINSYRQATNDMAYSLLFRILYRQLEHKLAGERYITYAALLEQIDNLSGGGRLRWYVYKALGVPSSMQARQVSYSDNTIIEAELKVEVEAIKNAIELLSKE